MTDIFTVVLYTGTRSVGRESSPDENCVNWNERIETREDLSTCLEVMEWIYPWVNFCRFAACMRIMTPYDLLMSPNLILGLRCP